MKNDTKVRRAWLLAAIGLAIPAFAAIAHAAGYPDEPRFTLSLRYRDASHGCPSGVVTVVISGPGRPAGTYNVVQPSGMRIGYCKPGLYNIRGTYRDPRTGRMLVATTQVAINSRGGSGMLVFRP